MSFVLPVFVPHVSFFAHLGMACFVIVAFPGYLYLYFCYVPVLTVKTFIYVFQVL